MAEDQSPTRIEISYKTIVFTVAVLIGLWFLIQIRDIIILIFLSIILLSALLKPVDWLNAKGIPRVLSAILVYIVLIALLSFTIGIIFPPLIDQTSEFVSKLPTIALAINDFLIFNKIPVEDISRVLVNQINVITGNVLAISSAIFGSIFLLLTLFVFTFYLLLEWKNFVRLIASPFSGKQEKVVSSIITKVENGLGRWLRGQLSLSLIIGILTYIGLRILGIPYALPLALIAGILEIIPIIGPIISAIPAVLVGLTISPFLALAAAALFFIIQQLENNLIVPMVMSKVVGIQPPVVIIALLIGSKLAGVGGAFLAVPIIVTVKIVVNEILGQDQKLEDDLKED
ncbi:AI-2E family transporter [Candidatus Curtissbacteria bacterium]|nr:AI-2E family transporter [Candidatus Curtissbacteria bacterium]